MLFTDIMLSGHMIVQIKVVQIRVMQMKIVQMALGCIINFQSGVSIHMLILTP